MSDGSTRAFLRKMSCLAGLCAAFACGTGPVASSQADQQSNQKNGDDSDNTDHSAGSPPAPVVQPSSYTTPTMTGTAAGAPLMGCPDAGYYLSASFGAQNLNVKVDNTIANLVVAGHGCTSCSPAPLYSNTTGGLGTYTADYYEDPDWLAEVWQDDIKISPMTSAVNMVFGSITSVQNKFLLQPSCVGGVKIGYSGVLGLGPDIQLTSDYTKDGTKSYTTYEVQNPLSQAANQQIIANNLMALQLCDVGGTYWLGDYNRASTTADITWLRTVIPEDPYFDPSYSLTVQSIQVGGKTVVGLSPNTLGVTAIDTTSPSWFVSTRADYNAILAALVADGAFHTVFGVNEVGTGRPATSNYPTPASVDAALPTVGLTVMDIHGQPYTWTIPATKSYLTPQKDSNGQYVYAMSLGAPAAGYTVDPIVGNAMMRGHVLLFERTQPMLGIAPSTGCASTSLPDKTQWIKVQ